MIAVIAPLLALREAARMVPNCAQPIIFPHGTKLRKNFPRFGRRRVAVRSIAPQNLPTSTIALTPL